jgi:hypothetical protein
MNSPSSKRNLNIFHLISEKTTLFRGEKKFFESVTGPQTFNTFNAQTAIKTFQNFTNYKCITDTSMTIVVFTPEMNFKKSQFIGD